MPRTTRLLVASLTSVALVGLVACTSILGDFDVASPGDGSDDGGPPNDGSSGEASTDGAPAGTFVLSAGAQAFVKASASVDVPVTIESSLETPST